MLTRRTVLVAGTAVAGVAAAGGAVLVARRPTLPLTLAALRPLVGDAFEVDGRTVTLASVTGRDGGRATEASFALRFTGAGDLPGATRTFAHADGDLVLHAEPVGAERSTLEAVVARTA
ncbi:MULTISPECIES: DUF6916 family protein [Micrococcales]|uniref:DUF6916 family protein n=1 Tax=Micrococcales TaxID=85006 RepID=UPI00130EDF84|nr:MULTISPECIES: hypothetical protein [Micrococcales]MCG7284603.1 hypothetical protein [Cellulomonas sp. ACRRI]